VEKTRQHPAVTLPLSLSAVLELLKALATPAIAVAGIVIAWAQLRIANIRLTHDLFDRRYPVYVAAREFLRCICQKRTITADELSSFHYASGTAIFVLNPELADYLQQIRTNAIRAAELFDKIGNKTASQVEIQEHWDLLNWLANQQEQMNEKFMGFLTYPRPLGRGFKISALLAFSLPVAFLAALLMLTDKSTARNPFLPPTATEIFHLRSECATLGEKILSENVVGSALTQSQISRYNPITNRCYVKLTVQSADINKPEKHFSAALYDGQTGEMLAIENMENGQRSGIVFDRNHKSTSDANAGWDDAQDYIDALMADDRKE
jgi:uncharacterized protein YqfB (UPF0267 family)